MVFVVLMVFPHRAGLPDVVIPGPAQGIDTDGGSDKDPYDSHVIKVI
jgi:hypothetical protein